MTLTRRAIFAGTAAITIGSPAISEACSLVARRRPESFSDAACRRSLGELVRLINDAPGLSDEVLATRAGELSINFDPDVTEPILDYPNRKTIENGELLRAWTSSAGPPDRAPLRLSDVNLLKGGRGVALYQFTLRRERFFAEITEKEAAGDSCGYPEPAHYGVTRLSYLGVFSNNKLRTVSAFDEWLQQA
jgi:hypothetical protein